MKKRAKGRTSGSRNSFFSNSKNAIIALLLIAAAVTAYSVVNAATVSHSPSAIQPQGAGSGLDADTLQQLSAAAILAAGGGSNEPAIGGWTLLGYVEQLRAYENAILGYLPASAKEIVVMVKYHDGYSPAIANGFVLSYPAFAKSTPTVESTDGFIVVKQYYVLDIFGSSSMRFSGNSVCQLDLSSGSTVSLYYNYVGGKTFCSARVWYR